MNTQLLNSNRHDSIESALDYYEGHDLVPVLRDAMTAAGLDPASFSIDEIASLDEFHALGRAATVALAELAGVAAGERVLDVGAGIGGPARFLAYAHGAKVVALDATPRFCRAAEMLTQGAGLADSVQVVCGDALALPFGDGAFDLVWTQAVTQNIADKATFVSELGRVTRPGGRVAMFEVVSLPGAGELDFPVPWANGPDQSWLVNAADLRELLERGGLRITAWREDQAAIAAIAAAQSAVPAQHDGLGLGLLMPDYEARMAGAARNIAERRMTLVQAVATRPEAG